MVNAWLLKAAPQDCPFCSSGWYGNLGAISKFFFKLSRALHHGYRLIYLTAVDEPPFMWLHARDCLNMPQNFVILCAISIPQK